MYCKMCGSLLDDTDRFCKACGEKTDFHPPAESSESIERQEEVEVVFNPPFEDNIHHNRFYLVEEKPDANQEENKEEQEDREGFGSGDEIENQKNENIAAANPDRTDRSEFQWNVHDFPKLKKTEEAVFNWNQEETSQVEQKEAMAAALEEELFREIRDDSNRIKESNIDRFFTFSRKNEEFQKLLDQEYEKLNRHSTDLAFSEKDTDKNEPDQEEMVETAENQMPENNTTENQMSENLMTENMMPETEDTPSSRSQAAHLDEMAKARAAFFGEGLIKDNEEIIKKLEPDSEEEAAAPVETEAASNPEDFEAKSADTIEDTDDTIKNTDETIILRDDDGIENSDETETADKEVAFIQREADSDKAGVLPLADEQSNVDDAGPPPDLYPGLRSLDEIPQEQFGTEDEGGNKKHRGAQIALIIIAIILVIEISILAIRYFAPESSATKVINDTQTRIINVVTDWFGINGNNSGNPSDKETQLGAESGEPGENIEPPEESGSDLPAPDPVPMADKSALVSTQLDKNTNIQWIGSNDELGFVEGKDYGLADLNNSKPIENNIWMQKDGETVYYDQSLVGTIVAFDSQWIDYVNGGSNDVLNLLKKGSKAYENAVGFSKIGKVKESFKVLQIGEIRQGAKGFYVWAHEEIQITEKGVTTDKSYNWIYYLEPIDGKLNIVNYFKFK